MLIYFLPQQGILQCKGGGVRRADELGGKRFNLLRRETATENTPSRFKNPPLLLFSFGSAVLL
jgi:hypothetical protein